MPQDQASCDSFWPLSGPVPKMSPNRPTGTHFDCFPGLGRKCLITGLLGGILAAFWAWTENASEQASWEAFWLLSEPGPKIPQNMPPGTHFGNCPGLRRKCLRMNLLGIIFATFRAWAEHALEQPPRDFY